jgi:hypothetical protein
MVYAAWGVNSDRPGPSHSTGISQRLREITQQVLLNATLPQWWSLISCYSPIRCIEASSSRLRLLRLRSSAVLPQSISLVSSRCPYPLSDPPSTSILMSKPASPVVPGFRLSSSQQFIDLNSNGVSDQHVTRKQTLIACPWPTPQLRLPMHDDGTATLPLLQFYCMPYRIG